MTARRAGARTPPGQPSVRDLAAMTDEQRYRAMLSAFATAYGEELARHDFDLVHAHDYMMLECASRAVAAAARRRPRPAIVYDAHEWVRGLTNVPPGTYAASVAVEEEFIREADAVLTVSPVLADHLARDYALAERPALVLNAPVAAAVDPASPLSVRAAAGVADGVPLAVYAGAVKEARGVGTVVRALPLLPELHLAVVASTPQLVGVRELLAAAEELGCADRVHVVPYVPYDQVVNYLRTATFGVHPLLPSGNAELALPNKVFEYLHAGLPIVVSDMPVMAGLVRERGWGEAFAAGDPQAFAAAARRVLDDPGAYRAALEDPDARHEFSWERQAETIVATYDRLLFGAANDPAARAAAEASRVAGS